MYESTPSSCFENCRPHLLLTIGDKKNEIPNRDYMEDDDDQFDIQWNIKLVHPMCRSSRCQGEGWCKSLVGISYFNEHFCSLLVPQKRTFPLGLARLGRPTQANYSLHFQFVFLLICHSCWSWFRFFSWVVS